MRESGRLATLGSSELGARASKREPDVSFNALLAYAVVTTLAVLGIAFLRPAYLVPTVVGFGVVGAAPFVAQYLRARAIALAKSPRGARSYSVEPLSRVNATI